MRRKLLALLMLIILIINCLCATAQAAPSDYNASEPSKLTGDMLYAEAAVLIDADTGDILFAKNDKVRMFPASTTKVMTLLLALESGIDLDREIAIPQAAADIANDSSLVPVFPGELMTFGDLLYGFMLHSGNDGANAVAVLVAGSVDAFVDRMNARAEEIGCTGTHFANAHGYHNENHYSTAYDLALITKTAMQNETFRQIVSTPQITIHVDARGDLNIINSNKMLIDNSGYYYESCIGVKTGRHSAAGNCFVGAAERDGATLISVVLKCEDGDETLDEKWVDSKELFEYGWTCYDTYTIDQMFNEASSQIATVVVSNASEDDINGGVLDLGIAQVSDSSYLRMVENGNEKALKDAVDDFISRSTVALTHALTAPISQGEIIGNFSYQEPTTGETITALLVASRDVSRQPETATLTDVFPFMKLFGNHVFLILLCVLLVLIILIIIMIIIQHASRQRKRRRIYEQRRREYLRRQELALRRKRESAVHSRENTRRPTRER